MLHTPIRRAIVSLYAPPADPDSHRVRIVLAEKSIEYELVEVNPDHLPTELLELNPYGTLPTLVDRDLVLYTSGIIMEYLDERFPHPALMPVYPISRARTRIALHRIHEDWYPLMIKILRGSRAVAERSRRELTESILSVTTLFQEKPYFLSEEYSLVDCSLAPLFWRLKAMKIELPKEARAVGLYAKRLFERPTFQMSLTQMERSMEPWV